MTPGSNNLKTAQGTLKSRPVDSIYASPITAPERFYPDLQFKGFGGGVPINTETTAVKPRVGIAR